ncbi:phosphatase PAP2 family protein [Actinoplanes sp. NPDC049668]|uniref:phosphatase PAP2 family protein n=1 Tax=unclassified Actinoplanes TaxID=2626549 RepID=UPI0033B8260D
MKIGLRLTTAVLVAVLTLVPFALLAALVARGWTPLHELDVAVTSTLHDWALSHPHWTRAALWWTTIFSPNPLRLAALFLAIWLIRRRARRLALWVAVTMAVGGLLGAGLKLLVGRLRPDLLDPVASAPGLSFPSGHALNATLAAGVFVLVLLPVVQGRRRGLLWCAAIAVAVLTGLTRVVIGVHWTSDVVAGWLLGVAFVAATAAAFTRLGPAAVVEEGLDPGLAHPASRRAGDTDAAA